MRRTAAAAVAVGTVAALAACGTSGGSRSSPSSSPQPTLSAPHIVVTPRGGATTRGAVGSDVTTYHGDLRRTGDYQGVAAPTALGIGWNAVLDGEVYAQPLVVGGVVIAATEADTVYALDAATGAIRWQTHVGTPQRASALPCGNVSPTVGITGTPAYDPATGLVFAVAEEAGPRHELVGLDATTGQVRVRVGVDLGTPGTAPDAMQQRAALAVANGRVYVAFGGRAGDCGSYRGQVVGVPTSGTGALVSYTVPTAREAGAWAPPGPSVDAAGNVYVAVGNGAAGEDEGHRDDAYDHSDAVLELSPTLQLLDFYAPSDWRSQNAADKDLGSTGPTLLANGLLLAVGKSPAVYVTRQGALGGIGGQLTRTNVCTGFGGTAQSGDVVLLPCTDGTRAVRVGSDGTPSVLWHAASGLAGSPVVGGGAVWVLDQGSSDLDAVSLSTGATIGHAHLPAGITRFATPALWASSAFVGTTSGVVAVTGA